MSESNPELSSLARYQQQLAEERERACRKLAQVCDLLAALNVGTVEIEYDGYGDAGTVGSVTAYGAENQEITLSCQLHNDLVQIVETLLPSGWENNEGAFGQFHLDVAERRLTREHNWRVESTEYEEEEWEV